MSAVRLGLYSDTRFNSGVLTAPIPNPLSAQATLRLDGRNRLVMNVSSGESWLDSLEVRTVLRATSPDLGYTHEWRHRGKRLSLSGGRVEVTFDPMSIDLRDGAHLRDTNAGGATFYSISATQTSSDWIDNYALPALTAGGITWVAKGTVDDTALRKLEFEDWTPLQLMEALASAAAMEWQLRAGASQYLIDLVDEIGSSAAQVLIAEGGEGMLDLVVTGNRDGMYNVVRPRAAQPDEGESERLGIGFASWEVASIATDVITAQDRAGGAGPIAEDDQFINNYLLATDATLHKITDTDATNQTFTLEAGHGASFAVGDDFEIRKDSAGALLDELISPSGTTLNDRIISTYQTSFRGERNYTPNPFATDWTTTPTAVLAQVDGAHSKVGSDMTNQSGGNSLVLKNGPANESYSIGDRILYPGQWDGIVEANATADGAGAVTLTVDRMPSLVDNRWIGILHHSPPDNWTGEDGTYHYAFVTQRDPALTGSLTGAANGTVASTFRVSIKSLAAGAVIQAGDQIRREVSPGVYTYWMAALPATADGSGNVDVLVTESYGQNDGDEIRVLRPDFSSTTTYTNTIALNATRKSGSFLRAPPITVRAVPGLSRLWTQCGISIFAPGDPTVGEADIQMYLDAEVGSKKSPTLQLVNDSTEAILASTQYNAITILRDSTVHATLKAAYDLTVNAALAPQIKAVTDDLGPGVGEVGHEPVTFVRWVMMSLGPDHDFDPVWGSNATQLFQDGQLRLADHKDQPKRYECTYRQLKKFLDADPAGPALTLGGTVRIKSDTLGVDTTLRVVQITYDYTDEENTRIVLATRFELLTERLRAGLSGGAVASNPGGGVTSTSGALSGSGGKIRGTLILGTGTVTEPKQVNFGPEMITASEPGDTRRVFLWAGQDDDTEGKFLMDNQGYLEWGEGGANDQDSSLSRVSDQLTGGGYMLLLNPIAFVVAEPGSADMFRVSTDPTEPTKVWINNPGGVGTVDVKQSDATEPVFRSELSATGDDAWSTFVTGDAQIRHIAEADGKHWWGDGTSAVDTNLYRSAADTLKTDDAFVVGSNLTVSGTGPHAIGGAANSRMGIRLLPSVTVSSASAALVNLGGTITAAANNDVLNGLSLGRIVDSLTFAKGAFTGLTASALEIQGSGMAVTGSGTIDVAAALRIQDAPSIGTTNAAIYVASGDTMLASAFTGIGETTNANMTVGLTINQGANDDEILALKSSDVAHGMTSLAETDTYGSFRKSSATDGGMAMYALRDTGTRAFSGLAVGITANTTRSTSADGFYYLDSGIKLTTTFDTGGANANLFVLADANNARWLVDAEGDTHYDGVDGAGAWDDHDDVALLSTFRALTTRDNVAKRYFAEWIGNEHNARVLAETGVITLNDDGHHFVSTKGLNGLMIDSIRQVHERAQAGVESALDRVARLEAAMLQLPGGAAALAQMEN